MKPTFFTFTHTRFDRTLSGRTLSADTFAYSLRTLCAHFAHTLRTVSGSEFRFLGVRKRGRGKNPRPPRNEFGPKSTLSANFFGARYQQKAVGSNANLRPSGAREIIMVTKERPGGVVGEKQEGLVKGPATALRKSLLSRRSTGDNKKRKKEKKHGRRDENGYTI